MGTRGIAMMGMRVRLRRRSCKIQMAYAGLEPRVLVYGWLRFNNGSTVQLQENVPPCRSFIEI